MEIPATTFFQNHEADFGEYQLAHCEVAVVERGASVDRPTVSFNRSKVYINAALLRRAPELNYALFLVNCAAKKLILCPCDQNEKGATRLCTRNEADRKPRHISAGEFCNQMFAFMGWDTDCRYKIAGNLRRDREKLLIVFDLTDAEKAKLTGKMDAFTQESRELCAQPADRFGEPLEEYLANPAVKQFDEDTAISILSEHDEMAEKPLPEDAQILLEVAQQ